MSGFHNELIYNAAFNGTVAGAYAGKAPSPSYVPTDVLEGAQAIASAVDQAIPFDSTITASSSNPTALVPTTGTIVQAQISKTKLIFALVSGAQYAKTPIAAVDDMDVSYAAFAEGIAEAYNTLVTGLLVGTGE